MREDPDRRSPHSNASRGAADGPVDWTFLAVLLLAAALRLFGLTAMDVWVDEANAILTARQPASVVLDLLSRDSSPPLYYFLLKAWMAVFGDSPTAVRLPATLFSLGLVAAVYAIGRREISRSAGLWAAFLVAIAPTQVFYSQQARMYSLLPLLALGAWWLLVQYLRGGRPRDFWLSMVATAAALYTHNFAVYVALVHALLVIGSGQLFRRFGRWVVAVAFLSLAVAPWVPTLLVQLDNSDHYAWYVERWEAEGHLGAAIDSLRSWSPAGSMVMYARAKTIEWHGLPALVTAGFALWGAVALVRRRNAGGAPGPWWIVAACGAPVLAALAMSSLLTPHYVPGRVDQMMLPCFALLAGAGAAALRPVALQRVLALASLVVALVGRSSFQAEYRGRGVEGAGAAMAAAVVDVVRSGDVVLCTSLTRAPLEYYLQRAGVEAPILSFPRATARHLGSQNHRKLLEDEPALLEEAGVVLEEARALAGPGGRLVLLRTDIRVNEPFERASLQRRFGIAQLARVGIFKLNGTKEHVWLTLNQLDGAGPEPGGAPEERR